MKSDKIQLLGNYIPGQKRQRPNRGIVISKYGISPCLCDFSGGGNIIPTFLIEYGVTQDFPHVTKAV